jgi:hypothetical protein
MTTTAQGPSWLGDRFWGRLETREAVLVGTLVCAGQLSAGGARDDASAAHRFLIEFLEFCDGTDL